MTNKNNYLLFRSKLYTLNRVAVVSFYIVILSGISFALEMQTEFVLQNGHTGAVSSVTFSPDCKTIISGSLDKSIRIWENGSGKLIRILQGHSDMISLAAVSPDGKTIASCGWDKTVRIWESKSGKLIKTLEGHSDAVRAVRFSPDNKTIASGSRDSTIRLLEIESGNLFL